MGTTNDSDQPDFEERLDHLEAVVDRQQELLEEQRTTIDTLLERLDEFRDGTTTGRPYSRRSLLKLAGLVGLAGFGTGQAAADPQGQVGTSSDPLNALYTDELNGGVTGGTAVTDLTGSGLSISSGTLTASGAAAWEDANTNNLLEPTTSGKGLEVDQLGSDPTISDSNGALYASDGNATGSAGDVVVGSDDSGSGTRQTVLFEYANGAIPGGSLASDSVTDTELDLSISPTWTSSHTFQTGGTTRFTTGAPVKVSNANLQINGSNAIEDASGNPHMTLNDGGPLGVDQNLQINASNAIQDASGNDHITVNKGGNTKFNRTIEDSAGNAIDDFAGSNLSLNGNTLDASTGGGLPHDPGKNSNQQVVADFEVGSGASGEQSFVFQIDNNDIWKAYAEPDGSGGIANTRVEVMSGNLRIDGSNAIEDASGNDHITFTDGVNTDFERDITIQEGNSIQNNSNNGNAIEFNFLQISDGNTGQLQDSDSYNTGYVIVISRDDGSVGTFSTYADGPSVQNLLDPDAVFGTAKNDSNYNVYDDGSKFVLQNNEGEFHFFSIIAFT